MCAESVYMCVCDGCVTRVCGEGGEKVNRYQKSRKGKGVPEPEKEDEGEKEERDE